MLAELVPLVLVGGFLLLGLGTIEGAPAGRSAGRYRWPVIGLLFLASLAHVPVIPEHLEEAPYMGALMIAFSVASYTLAGLLAWNPAPVLVNAAAVLCAAAVLTYVATRLIAFPLLADDVGSWVDPWGVTSVLAETAVVALTTLWQRRWVPSSSR